MLPRAAFFICLLFITYELESAIEINTFQVSNLNLNVSDAKGMIPIHLRASIYCHQESIINCRTEDYPFD